MRLLDHAIQKRDYEDLLLKLDKTNVTILRTLLNEARTPLTYLAKQLNISIPSVSSRIEYLKKKSGDRLNKGTAQIDVIYLINNKIIK